MKKKLIALLLALTLGMGLAVPAMAAPAYQPVTELSYTGQPQSFRDVKAGDWYYSNLMLLVRAGGINGYEDGSFRPNSGLKLSEFLKMVVAIMYPAYLDDFANFTFGGEKLWYGPYVGLAEATGLLDGVTHTKKALEANVNRYNMAVIITNALRLRGEVAERDMTVQYFINDFNSIPASYRLAVRDAYQAGILMGKDDYGNFCGNDGLTRAEACTVVMRLFEERVRQCFYRELWDVTDHCRVLIRMPDSWKERVFSWETSGSPFTVEYRCLAAVDETHAGVLFSVVVADQKLKDPGANSTYLGMVSAGNEKHYVYIMNADTMQFDGFNAEIRQEFVSMDEDMKNDLVKINVIMH